MLELAGQYFDLKVTLFTIVFLILAAVEAGFLLYQLHLERQVTRAAKNAAAIARELHNQKRTWLASLNEHDPTYEVVKSLTNASDESHDPDHPPPER
jgi:hypothetical protein